MFFGSGGGVLNADMLARKYLPENIVNTGNIRFIRTEFFESDFKSVFGDYLDISRIPDREYKKRINPTKTILHKTIKEKLYNDERSVYNHCPYWKSLEEKAYSSSW